MDYIKMIPGGQVSPTHLFRSFEEADEFLRLVAEVKPTQRFDYWVSVGDREEWPGTVIAGEVIKRGGMVAVLEEEFKDVIASDSKFVSREWKQEATRSLEKLRKMRAPLPRPVALRRPGFLKRLTRGLSLQSFLGL